jgi:hypothetical protein
MSEGVRKKYHGIALWLVQQVVDSVSIYLRGSSVLPHGQEFPPWDIDIVLVTESLAIPLSDAAKLAARATLACGTQTPVDLFVVCKEDLLRSDKQLYSRVLLHHESVLLWGQDILCDVPRDTLNVATAKMVASELIRTVDVKRAQFVSRISTGDIEEREFEGRSKSLAKAGLRLACIESLVQSGEFVRSPADCMQVWQSSEHPDVKASASLVYQSLSGIARTDAVLLCKAVENMRLYVQRYTES